MKLDTRKTLIWAEKKEEFFYAKTHAIAPFSAVCSTLRFFTPDAERAESVFIAEGYPLSKACGEFYKAIGAKVQFFSVPKEDTEDKKKPSPKETK